MVISLLLIVFILEIIPDLVNRQFSRVKKMPFFWSKVLCILFLIRTCPHRRKGERRHPPEKSRDDVAKLG